MPAALPPAAGAFAIALFQNNVPDVLVDMHLNKFMIKVNA
jgi:hypothetical protein